MHKYFSKKSRMKFHQIENNIIDNKVTADVPKGTTLAGKWLLIIKVPILNTVQKISKSMTT